MEITIKHREPYGEWDYEDYEYEYDDNVDDVIGYFKESYPNAKIDEETIRTLYENDWLNEIYEEDCGYEDYLYYKYFNN